MTRKPGEKLVRCAVYTRKSTEEGLDQEFNTLDSQREYAEAYIKSQSELGWVCLPEHYDDGGFSGGNMDRPALQRLLADIGAGRIDCVLAYKIDRLSRSLLDFARMMEVFERRQVSFVSVTQQFNTATSMGRLMQNVLLSFAQFEREMISERTRDKIAATRRKGKWSGGMPLLGYDVVETKLVVNDVEAEQVRRMFELYLELGSLLPTVQELERRGWKTKRWTTRKGTERGGLVITKSRLYHLLTNVTYLGKIRYKEEVHEGEHEAIVEDAIFQRVRETLLGNRQNGGAAVRNKHGALLKGLVHCAACNCGMAHTYTSKGNKRYRYYVCQKAQQQGWKECPCPSVSAGELEQFVVDQIKCIGRDPGLVAATVAETRRQADEAVKRLKRERAALERQRRVDEAALAQLPLANDLARLAEVHERLGAAEQRFTEICEELGRLARDGMSEEDVASAVAEFDKVWEALTPREQTRVLQL